MENVNVGIVNLIIANELKNSFSKNELNESVQTLTKELLSIIKESPILQLEYKVINNIENKFIENELAATRYIDNNIKLFEIYTIDEIEKEHNKLKGLVNENITVDDERLDLYNSIHTLIIESLNDYEKINVDEIHEAFTYTLNHVRTPKNNKTLTNDDSINESIIEIAIDKYNQKYSSLNEEEKSLIKKLASSNEREKRELFESYRNENISIFKGIEENGIEEKVSKTLVKLNEMTFNKETAIDDILKLYELKEGLK